MNIKPYLLLCIVLVFVQWCPLHETHITLDAKGNLKITDIKGGTSNSHLLLSINGNRLRVTDHSNKLSGDGIQINANTKEIPLKSITGDLLITNFSGKDTLSLAADLQLKSTQSIYINGVSHVILDADLSLGNLQIHHATSITQNGVIGTQKGSIDYQASDGIVLNQGAALSGAREVKLSTENVLKIAGSIQNDSSNVGGSIALIGKDISLEKHSSISSNGAYGGGRIRIGGDLQGKGSLPKATKVYIAKGAQISSNALLEGNGGSIIVWSDQETTVGGNFIAQGGLMGGDGGFVETSGASIDIAQQVKTNLFAAHGENGTWLIDPEEIEINSSPTISGASLITASTIEANLNTAHVIISSNNALAGNGNITVNESISSTSSNNLTLNAGTGGSINVYQSITVGGDLTLNAGNGADGADGVDATTTLAATNGVKGGDGGNVLINASITSSGGNVKLKTGAGGHGGSGGEGVYLGSSVALNSGANGGEGGFGGSITVNAAIAADGAVNLFGDRGGNGNAGGAGYNGFNGGVGGDAGDAGNVTINDQITAGTTVAATASYGGDAGGGGSNGGDGGDGGNGGNIIINTPMIKAVNGQFQSGRGGLRGTYSISGIDGNYGNSGTVVTSQALQLDGTGDFSFFTQLANGFFTVNASSGNINLNHSITSNGNVTISSGGHISGGAQITAKDISLIARVSDGNIGSAGQAINTHASGVVSANSTLRGSIFINNRGDLVLENFQVSFSGELALTAVDGSITSGNNLYLFYGDTLSLTTTEAAGNNTPGDRNIHIGAGGISDNDTNIIFTAADDVIVDGPIRSLNLTVSTGDGIGSERGGDIVINRGLSSDYSATLNAGNGIPTAGVITGSEIDVTASNITVTGTLKPDIGRSISLLAGTNTGQSLVIYPPQALSLTGTGSLNLRGFDFSTTNQYSTVDGDISIDGGNGSFTLASSASLSSTGSGTIRINTGTWLLLSNNSSITTNKGDITLNANVDAIADMGDFEGISMVNADIRTNSGAITLNGRAGNSIADPDRLNGLDIRNGSTIISTGTGSGVGTISLSGTGGNGISSNYGVWLRDTGTRISSVDADIAITGNTGTNLGDFNIGILQYSGAVVETTGTGTHAGDISYMGFGNGVSHNYGINLYSPNTSIQTTDGNISLSATGSGTFGANDGLLLGLGTDTNGSISSSRGNINLNGTGGPGFSGVLLFNSNGLVDAGEGNVIVNAHNGGIGATALIEGNDIALSANSLNAAIGSKASVIRVDASGVISTSASNGDGGIYVTDTGSFELMQLNSGSGDVILEGTTDMVLAPSSNISATASATLVLAAGDDFHNDSGSNDPFNDHEGLWVVYSTHPDNNRQDLEIMRRDYLIYNQNYNALDPIPTSLPAGNGLIFSGSLINRHYVNSSATGSNGGESWVNAYNDLQDALDNALAEDEIWVATGTYTPTSSPDGSTTNLRNNAFHFDKNLKIYGGFSGTESLRTQRDWRANPTILSGELTGDGDSMNNAHHIMISINTSNTALIDGFTIKDGYVNGGGPMSYEGTPINAFEGAGLYLINSDLQLENLDLTNNIAADFSKGNGAGLKLENSNPSLTHVNFINNKASLFGAGMYNENSDPELINVVFYKNIVDFTHASGGGMYNNNSNPTLTNVLFVENSAPSASGIGGGMFNNSSSNPTLSNVSFYNNSVNTVNGRGGAMFNEGLSHPYLTNTVFFDNKGKLGGDIGGDVVDTRSSHNASDEGAGLLSSTNSSTYIDLSGMSSATLFFNLADPDGADNSWGTTDDGLIPASSSVLIDAGDSSQNTLSFNLANTSRIQGSAIDIGAYEADGFIPETQMRLIEGTLSIIDINGGVSNNELSLSVSGTLLIVKDQVNTIIGDGTEIDAYTRSIPLSSISSITINTMSGTDSVTLSDSLVFNGNGGIQILGNTSVLQTGSITLVDGEINYTVSGTIQIENNAQILIQGNGNVLLITTSDVKLLSSIRSLTTGGIYIVSGWDGVTLFDLTNYAATTAASITTSLVASVTTSTLFGNNRGEIRIGDGSQAAGISIGSREGVTVLFGGRLSITGANTGNGGFAQLGFQSSNQGSRFNILGRIIIGLKNDLILTGGSGGTFNYAQIGHIGADVLSINDSDGMVTGNIYLALGGSIDVVGGSDYSSFAQLGHGGLHAIATYIGKYLLLTPNVRLSLRSNGNGYSRLGND